ncbi:MAG: prepilin-type N-terminal cleavage/methylation domain-containing protein [Cyanobacteria bacterium J069]|nr:MAG: prepilin-type N-terminal cleavage/methylation domain-containing protein [Cyanobacteria bacterium J069]
MLAKRILGLLKRRPRPATSQTAGFTLTELLIVAIISSIIISGLMYLVVELLTADQREASRSETQREMQQALDYISAELREATFVYRGRCLGAGIPANAAAVPPEPGCPGLQAALAGALPANTTPVLAFWKQDPLPNALRERCRTTQVVAGNYPVPCVTGSSYSLVVYSLNTGNPTNLWRGRARITRYVLQEFTQSGTNWSKTAGYVAPSGGAFASWQPASGETLTTNGSNPAVLVDFVDDGQAANALGVPAPACSAGYNLSPENAIYRGGLYACVSNETATSQFRDVSLFIRGNAFGRPSIASDREFTTTLQTRVLGRAVLERNPSSAGP